MNTLIDRPGVVTKKHAQVIYNDIWAAQTCLMTPQSVAIESYAFLGIKNMQKHIKTPSECRAVVDQTFTNLIFIGIPYC